MSIEAMNVVTFNGVEQAPINETTQERRGRLSDELGQLSLQINLVTESYNDLIHEITNTKESLAREDSDVLLQYQVWLDEEMQRTKQALNRVMRRYNECIRETVATNQALSHEGIDRHHLAYQLQRPIDPGSAMGDYISEGYLDTTSGN